MCPLPPGQQQSDSASHDDDAPTAAATARDHELDAREGSTAVPDELNPGEEPALHLPILDASITERRAYNLRHRRAITARSKLVRGALAFRPTWRGWIHAATMPVAVAAGIVLIALADGNLAKFAAVIYAICSWLLFGVSAVYHRFNWSMRAKVALKRFDHANIFLLIAGTYTPISLLALPSPKDLLLFSAVWAAALLGISFRVFWVGAPRWLYTALYIALGWAAIMFIVDLFEANAAMMILIVIGGVLYTLGAVVYATKWPNPSPKHFGFHEIFHGFTVAAFLCQWAGVLLVSLNPPYGA